MIFSQIRRVNSGNDVKTDSGNGGQIRLKILWSTQNGSERSKISQNVPT